MKKTTATAAKKSTKTAAQKAAHNAANAKYRANLKKTAGLVATISADPEAAAEAAMAKVYGPDALTLEQEAALAAALPVVTAPAAGYSAQELASKAPTIGPALALPTPLRTQIQDVLDPDTNAGAEDSDTGRMVHAYLFNCLSTDHLPALVKEARELVSRLQDHDDRFSATLAGIKVREELTSLEKFIKKHAASVPKAPAKKKVAVAKTPAKVASVPATPAQALAAGAVTLNAVPDGTRDALVAEVIRLDGKLLLVKASNHAVVHAPRAEKPGVVAKLNAYASKRGMFVVNMDVASNTVVLAGQPVVIAAE